MPQYTVRTQYRVWQTVRRWILVPYFALFLKTYVQVFLQSVCQKVT